MKYFLAYGFLGGANNGKRFRKLMEDSGHHLTESSEHADIIIAHSAGCWNLPTKIAARLIIYVGLPLANPGLLTSLKNNLAVNKYFIRTFSIKAALLYYWRALFYGLTQPRRNFRIITNAKNSKFNDYESCKIVMISNQEDFWAVPPDIFSFTNQHRTWSYLSLPGTHDDIWENPNTYVDIINTLARSLKLS